MAENGIAGYLLLVDPESFSIKWANHNCENVMMMRANRSCVGMQVSEAIPFGEEIGLLRRIADVAATGEPSHLTVARIGPGGTGSRTDASIYRLPSGDVLIATEYVPGVEEEKKEK